MPAVPKPEPKRKKEKPYNSLQRKAKKDRVVPEWKRDILAAHSSRPSAADRAEFPRKVIQEAIERAAGRCEACKTRPDTESHHVQPKGGRKGRGVLSNLLRVCHECHMRIQTNEEELQYWISEYRQRYGDHFYFDEQDHEEYARKQAEQREAAEERKQRLNELEPVINLLSTAAGRKLKSNELRLLDNLDEREMIIFAGLMADVVKGQIEKPSIPFGYGDYFDD